MGFLKQTPSLSKNDEETSSEGIDMNIEDAEELGAFEDEAVEGEE